MSDYAHRPGGSLKFKGGDDKKKKKKSRSKGERSAVESIITEKGKAREKVDEADDVRESKGKAGKHGDYDEKEEEPYPDKPTMERITPSGRKMTEAERRFEEVNRKRRQERVAKSAKQTHKDRVSEFNSKLDRLTEHNDIPKISWTA